MQRRHDRGGAGDGPASDGKKGQIERAYAVAEREGLPVWNQDEAGPYQAIPQPGPAWQPEGEPARQPHEYVRGGTAKLLTLFHPATGQVRAKGVTQATNAVVHPWLQEELTAVLAELPPVTAPEAAVRQWETWGWDAAVQESWGLTGPLPPIRLILIWDNLTGHKNRELVRWLVEHGVLPLYTPIGGSWLNMAESVQRILVRRALAGQHPETAAEVIAWLEATVAGWNQAPTPFEWGGKRAARRQRARERRHRLGGSGAYTRRPIRRSRLEQALANGEAHNN